MIRFTYKLSDVHYIIRTLESNHRDIGKAFNSTWSDRFRNLPREYAPVVLDLVLKVNSHMAPCCNHPKVIWQKITGEFISGQESVCCVSPMP